MQDPQIAIARRSPLLANLHPSVIAELLQRSRLRSFDRGTTIFLQGESARSVRIVLSGWVKLYRIASNGSEAVLQLLTTGRSFEELPALQGGAHKASAQAVSPCTLLHIDSDRLQQAALTCPDIAMAVLRATSEHVDDIFGHVEQLKVQSGAQRLADFLLDLCPPDCASHELVLPFEKALVAGKLGMKPESLSRAFGRLNRLGVRVRQQRISIHCVAALRSYAAEDPAQAWTQAGLTQTV